MVKLYLAKTLGRFFPNSCWKNKEKFEKLYDDGEQKIQELLDMAILVKTLRTNKIMLEQSMCNKEIMYLIKHGRENWIDLTGSVDINEKLNISKASMSLD